MQKLSIFLGFIPWIVFGVVAGPSTWVWAAVAGLVSSLILAVPDWRRIRSISVLDAAGLVFFAALVVLAFILDRADLQLLEDNAQLLSNVVIAVVALGSVAVGRPFTEYYARQDTPREYWGNPVFRRINRVLTLVWGAVFVASALCTAAVQYAGASSDLFTWVVPVGLIVAGVKFTEWYPDHVTGPDAEAATHAQHRQQA